MRFSLELHNLFSTWHDEEDTKEEVNKLRLAVKKNSRDLPMFTDGSKRSAIDTGGYQPSHRTGNAAIDAVERLEGSVYDVVPDDHETDGSTWELYEKVQHRNYISTHDVALTVVLQPPPHVRIVYRQKDPNKPNTWQSTSLRDRTSWPSTSTSNQNRPGLLASSR